MLVTRPEPDASETAARLRALDIEPIVAPLLNFELLHTSLPDPQGFAAIAATSANALRALHDRGEIPHFRHLKLYAVGDRTAAAGREFGFAEVVSASGDFASLVALLAQAGVSGPILYPAAQQQAGDLAKALAPHGVMVITAPVYRMSQATHFAAETSAALESGAVSAALFYSRRSAEAFVHLADFHMEVALRRSICMLCISENVARPLIHAHFVRTSLAEHPSDEAMLGLALSFARDQNPA